MSTASRPDPWIPLWDAKRVAAGIVAGPLYQAFDEPARRELAGVPDIPAKVIGALQQPKPLDIHMPVLNAVLAAQYYEVFQALRLPGALAVYEPCVGASPPVIFATEAFSQGRGSYTTINLNRPLCAQLRARIGHLRMALRIIEDNAQTALEHLPAGSVDVACFHHAINDILQTAVAEPRGMDTTAVDWFPNERQMIQWLAEEATAHRLEPRGRPELMRIVGDAVRLVRPGGYLLFDHWNWCRFIGVDWFPWELFYNLIPLARQWLAESGLPLTEVRLEGIDPQWWMTQQVQ